MAVRPIDANAMLNELRPVSFESEHSAMLLSDVSKMMREWVERQPTLTPQNEWVSVEERLPDELTMVLIYSGGIYDVAGWIEDEDGKICWTHNAKPQFWRPIPGLEPPGKDNNVPTKEQNEPLTLDELLKMDGEPVYVVFRPDISGEKSQSWALVNVDEKFGEVYLVDSIPGASCYYDEIWANLEGIYRRPPERQEDT